jgi:hypothetical protein
MSADRAPIRPVLAGERFVDNGHLPILRFAVVHVELTAGQKSHANGVEIARRYDHLKIYRRLFAGMCWRGIPDDKELTPGSAQRGSGGGTRGCDLVQRAVDRAAFDRARRLVPASGTSLPVEPARR